MIYQLFRGILIMSNATEFEMRRRERRRRERLRKKRIRAAIIFIVLIAIIIVVAVAVSMKKVTTSNKIQTMYQSKQQKIPKMSFRP